MNTPAYSGAMFRRYAPASAPSFRRPLALLLAGLSLGAAVQADNLSASAAEAALAGGAVAWDLRADAGSGLPGAVRIDAAALQAWLQRRDLAALQAAVSKAGIDLSREVVVYGEPGDAQAQALVDSLQPLSRGRVHWLVGGATEWAMTGRSLQALASSARQPVPQHLVAQGPAADSDARGQMASVALRGDAQEARSARLAAR